jgi:hypothetical protein
MSFPWWQSRAGFLSATTSKKKEGFLEQSFCYVLNSKPISFAHF